MTRSRRWPPCTPNPAPGTTPRADSARRSLYLALGAGLTAFAIVEMIPLRRTAWFALAFFLLPDLALFYGAAS